MGPESRKGILLLLQYQSHMKQRQRGREMLKHHPQSKDRDPHQGQKYPSICQKILLSYSRA